MTLTDIASGDDIDAGPLQSIIDHLKGEPGDEEAWFLRASPSNDLRLRIASGQKLLVQDPAGQTVFEVSGAGLIDNLIIARLIAAGAVTEPKIGTGAVTGTKIAANQINSQHYVAASIDTEHIANDQVTSGKLSAAVRAILGRVPTANPGNNLVWKTDADGAPGWRADAAGAGGASAFSGLTGTIAIGQIANGLITRAKLASAVTAVLDRVPTGSPGNNLVWKTDNSGSPGWRTDASGSGGAALQTTGGTTNIRTSNSDSAERGSATTAARSDHTHVRNTSGLASSGHNHNSSYISSSPISAIWSGTASAYAGISSKSNSTLYLVDD